MQQLTTLELAQTLAEWYRAGKKQEIEKYLREAGKERLQPLSELKEEAPWYRDAELWWFLENALYGRLIKFKFHPDILFKLLDELDSWQRRELAAKLFISIRNASHVEGICNEILDRLIYKYPKDFAGYIGIAPLQVLRVIWNGNHPSLELKILNNIEKYLDNPFFGEFFEGNPDILYRLSAQQLSSVSWILSLKTLSDLDWKRIDISAYQCLIEHFISLLREKSYKGADSHFDWLAQEYPNAIYLALNDHPYFLSNFVVNKICQGACPNLLPRLPGLISQQYFPESFSKEFKQILDKHPEFLNSVKLGDFLNIFPLLKGPLLTKVLAPMGRLLAGTSSTQIRQAVAERAKDFKPEDLRAAGWLSIKNKNMQILLRNLLFSSPYPEAKGLLEEMLKSGRLDLVSVSLIEAHLGLVSSESSNEPALQAIEQQAASVKRLSSKIEPYAGSQVFQLLKPLSEHAARVLLHLAATERELPFLAKQMLALIPAAQRAQLALILVNIWVNLDGDPKHRWALQLNDGVQDELLANNLVKAVMLWGKPKKQRAVAALEHLAAQDSPYALAQVRQISITRNLKDVVISTARELLAKAADTRKISLADLLDELTPDFGLAQGVDLKVGEHCYRVVLLGDLSLRILDEKGKQSKSLPALKDESLRDEWEQANHCYKALQSSLKSVLKQQEPRMQEAFYTGRVWPVERWKRLFLEHPLLRVAGRSLIWQCLDTAGKPLNSFRIAEDFTLLNLNDDTLELSAQDQLTLWHPVMASKEEVNAWRAHLEDYQLKALVNQVDSSAQLPEVTQIKDGLLPARKIVVEHQKMLGLLRKWGYRDGPIGDGPSIDEHSWRVADLIINLHHSGMPPYMFLGYQITIDKFMVYKSDWTHVDLAEAPKQLLATLMDQLNKLEAVKIN